MLSVALVTSAALLFLPHEPGSAQTAGGTGIANPYPALGSLGTDDLVYRQQQEQLEFSYEAIQSGKKPPISFSIHTKSSPRWIFFRSPRDSIFPMRL
jgi:hypothetical protein